MIITYAIIFLWSAVAGAFTLDSGSDGASRPLGIVLLLIASGGGVAFAGWTALIAVVLGFLAGPAIQAAVGSSKK